MNTLKIFFPGRRYSVDRSYLYFLDKYIDGESIYLEYDFKRWSNPSLSLEDNIKIAYEVALKKLENIDFSKYNEIIFIAKSVGTVVAAKLRNELRLFRARLILLTPLTETIPFLRQTDFIVTSFKDEYIDASVLKENENRFPFLTIYKDVRHSLEFPNNLKRTIDLIYEIVELALNYLDTAYKDILE